MEMLEIQLKLLRLSHMSKALTLCLQEAKANELSHEDFLSALLQEELQGRKDGSFKKRLKQSKLDESNTVDKFDFSFNNTISKKLIKELATSRFVHMKENVLFLGPPGVGKTHLATALGIQAIASGYEVLYCCGYDIAEAAANAHLNSKRDVFMQRLIKPGLLILDEFGMKELSNKLSEDLLEVIYRRYKKSSTIICTNRPIKDWGTIFGDTHLFHQC